MYKHWYVFSNYLLREEKKHNLKKFVFSFFSFHSELIEVFRELSNHETDLNTSSWYNSLYAHCYLNIGACFDLLQTGFISEIEEQ